ncbi:glutathione-dependent formaldehyde-activating gfa [Grosmannia clavigera kw1407]|uniref:Glutathione-dependent formaldehyde-activating gfa n=1 Tax=Grosmannia clavigera (strain kw1407 / UAMH 11150) TaxID=655863 RepID=F0XF78_GROCL|nr:glutathione-dependent formaldehyde-activating gfa [Grosmannia clavigera kw1407]EFX04745.1 glutathione-dependent formaldehyde-activating gfa [Grosmannia clavigera kw1407]
MDIACQCKTVTFRLPTAAPLAVYHCHCDECRHQSSSAYGTSAIFPVQGILPLEPAVRTKVSVYRRPGERYRSGRDMGCYFCTTCGSRLLHQAIEADGTGAPTVSVKGGVIVSGLDWTAAQHIYADKAVVPIPEGAVRFPGTPPSE